jgi:anti-sigma factor RsiW
MHDRFHDLLQQYIDRELDQLETMILGEHLSSCQDCRKLLNQLKLMDWDLKHEPTIEPPPELFAYRTAAIKAHLAAVKTAEDTTPLRETWRLQRQILQHTFSFMSYSPVNRTVARSVKKTVTTLTRAAGSRIRKRSPIFSKFIFGQA